MLIKHIEFPAISEAEFFSTRDFEDVIEKTADQIWASLKKYGTPDPAQPHCECCGTLKNLSRDYGSGGPWRCNSRDCIVF